MVGDLEINVIKQNKMKKGEVLILTREDLIESSKTNLDITISDIENDNTELRVSDIILFLDDNSEAKILKNRYGNNGTIIQKVYNIPYVPFAIAFHTVDVIATRKKDENLEILLGRKHDSKVWVFIGGFVEPTHTAEHTAMKEFYEEANVEIEDEDRFKYLGSAFINDVRFEKICHKVTTSLFTIRLTDEESLMCRGGDDIEEVKWFSIKDVNVNLKDCHQKLFVKFLLSNV